MGPHDWFLVPPVPSHLKNTEIAPGAVFSSMASLKHTQSAVAHNILAVWTVLQIFKAYPSVANRREVRPISSLDLQRRLLHRKTMEWVARGVQARLK